MRKRFPMNRANPPMQNFATLLTTYETGENKSSDAKLPGAFQIIHELRPHLATLMGEGGFRALLARALTLAGAEVPWLRAVHVKADGALAGVEELRAQLGRDEFFECGVVLLTQLLELLVTFIGENLTLRLVREVCPKVSLNELGFSSGGKTGLKTYV